MVDPAGGLCGSRIALNNGSIFDLKQKSLFAINDFTKNEFISINHCKFIVNLAILTR